jgi:hypothetical protein
MLELQRHAMLMYTSCGWFFDELSGIETVQVIQYAGRVVQLARDVLGRDLEPAFLEHLEQAKSNLRAHRDGRLVYEKFVKPAVVDLEKVAAHYATSSLFEDYEEETDIDSYRIHREVYQRAVTGKARLALGRIRVVSKTTGETGRYAFGILHWGELNLSGCVVPCGGEEPDTVFVQRVFEIFARADFSGTLQNLEKRWGNAAYSLRNLFRDEQRKIFGLVHETSLRDTEAVYRRIYENHVVLLRFLTDLDIPRPKGLRMAADFVFNEELRRAFEQDELDLNGIRKRQQEAALEGTAFDSETLEMPVRRKFEEMIGDCMEKGCDPAGLRKLDDGLGLIRDFPFEVNLREVQNRYFKIGEEVVPERQRKAEQGDRDAGEVLRLLRSIGEKLSIRIEPENRGRGI